MRSFSGILSILSCSFQTRIAMANLYLLKGMDSHSALMADRPINRELSFKCRHVNRLQLDTTA
jgi:hypothetical protein